MLVLTCAVDYVHSETTVTALMVAAGRGFFGTVEQLLNMGANVSAHSSNNWTALDWARQFEQHDVVELLETHMYRSVDNLAHVVIFHFIANADSVDDTDDCCLGLLSTDRAAIEEVTPDESLLLKQSSVLSAEDRDLLACYHHGFDDEKVDIDLLICLLFAIHSQPREGPSVQYSPQETVFPPH